MAHATMITKRPVRVLGGKDKLGLVSARESSLDRSRALRAAGMIFIDGSEKCMGVRINFHTR